MLMQALLTLLTKVWIVSLPVTILNSPNIQQYDQPAFDKATDIIGIIGFAIGLTMEAVSDVQKYRFKGAHKEQPNAVCDVGFYKWSRHVSCSNRSSRTPRLIFLAELFWRDTLAILHLYDRRHTSLICICAWRRACCTIRECGGACVFDHPAHVRLWPQFAGTAKGEENV